SEAARRGERGGDALQRLQGILGGRQRLGPREQLARFRLRARRLSQKQERIARFSRSDLALAQAPQRRQVLAIDGVVEPGSEPASGPRRGGKSGEISGAAQGDATTNAEGVQRRGGEREDLGIRLGAGGA